MNEVYDIDCSRCSGRDAAAEEMRRAARDMPAGREPDSRVVWVPLLVLIALVLAVWCGYAWYCEVAARILGAPA